jgi:3-methyladenine DNA glycosylase/8-oxoguanine DNA glycosylase
VRAATVALATMTARTPDSAALRALARRDPALGALMRRTAPFPGFPDARQARWSHYESLARAIVYQQLSGKAAATIWSRACALTPGSSFPRAEDLLRLSDETLRGAGLSRQKVLALRDLAEHVARRALRLPSLHRLPDAEVIEHLIQVRGIGVWSAQMFLLFKLGRLDVLAPGDLGLQEGLRRLDRRAERPTPKELEARGAVWAPLRSVASWHLWRATELEPESAEDGPAAR